MKLLKKIKLPLGFKANGVPCGIKKSGRLDLALFYSDRPAKAACKFTTNKLEAAPIKINKRYLKHNSKYHAIIVNSGNANCFTGKPGLMAAENTTREAAGVLNLKKESVLVASTGIIGKALPFLKIKLAVPALVKGLSRDNINKAKQAIITTDTFVKEAAIEFNVGGRMVTICGVAKGAGMIAPDMATMLCFIFTDAVISRLALNKALDISVSNSFNCITVDGCMSTNDSVMVLANGASGNRLIEDSGKNFALFLRALNTVCLELAKMVVRDGEGATKFIQIKLDGAPSAKDAKKMSLAIANSNLFKTAMYGQNPNFGRIVSALGACGIGIKEEELKIKASPLNKKEIVVDVRVGKGTGKAVVYTSDLTPEYVLINAEYN